MTPAMHLNHVRFEVFPVMVLHFAIFTFLELFIDGLLVYEFGRTIFIVIANDLEGYGVLAIWALCIITFLRQQVVSLNRMFDQIIRKFSQIFAITASEWTPEMYTFLVIPHLSQVGRGKVAIIALVYLRHAGFVVGCNVFERKFVQRYLIIIDCRG